MPRQVVKPKKIRSLARLALPGLILLAICVSWLAAPASALAHAKLLKSSPSAGALLDSSPSEVRLYLSEGASLQFSYIKILDRARDEQKVGPTLSADNHATTIKADIQQPLAPGVYTVLWRVLSAADGHLTAGTFSFRIKSKDAGNANTSTESREPTEVVPTSEPANATPLEGTGETPSLLRWILRALILASASLLVGGTIFTLGIVGPVLAGWEGEAGAAIRRSAAIRFSRIGAAAAALLVVGLVADLLAQVSAIGEGLPVDASGVGNLAWMLLSTTRYGFAWELKALAAVLLLAAMLFAWRSSRRSGFKFGPMPWNVAFGAGCLLLIAEALSSHAAALSSGDASANLASSLQLPWASDWIHLLTSCAWAGGLGYMALVLFPVLRKAGLPPSEMRQLLGQAVPRFSKLAIASVVVLAVTGTYNLLVHSTDLGAIIGSSYGQVLMVKVGLFAALIALGAMNLLRLSPRLSKDSASFDDEAKSVAGLRRNVRIEVVLIAIVLVSAGGLSLLPPPSSAGAGYIASPSPEASGTPSKPEVLPTVPPTPQPATSDTMVAGYQFSFTTRPSIDGDELTLTVTKMLESASPLTDVKKVIFKVTPQDIDGGSTSYEAVSASAKDGNRQIWTAREPILTLDGNYLVTVIVQRTLSNDLKAAFTLELSESSGLKASPSQVVEVRVDTSPSPPISGTATLTLQLVDGVGAPITDAKLTVNPLMPAHAHTEPVGQAVPVEGKPGTYTLPVHFVMTGAWLLIFNVEREGQPVVKTDASVDVWDANATPMP